MKLSHVGSVIAVLLGASAANATLHTVNVSLTGSQERPTPTASPGSGTALVTFDDLTGIMTVNGTYTGLTSASNAAHVHAFAPLGNPGDPGTTASPAFNLVHSSATSGVLTGTGTFAAADIQRVLDGLTYINVHSGQFPGGEIRGQILIPEPASLAGLGLISLLALRRRA